MRVLIALFAAGMILAALPAGADGCSQGPLDAPNQASIALEQPPTAWGGYCEGTVDWSITGSADGLTLAHLGGDPYSNVHFYRNVQAPDGRRFDLSLAVDVPETTFANQGAPSLVQAIEFGTSLWRGGWRHEWAIQWMNVGGDRSEWRIWDPAAGWVSVGVGGELAPGTHRIEIGGSVGRSGDRLTDFTIDGRRYRVGVALDATPAAGWPDMAAVAVQLDSNYAGDAYAVTVRDVSLDWR